MRNSFLRNHSPSSDFCIEKNKRVDIIICSEIADGRIDGRKTLFPREREREREMQESPESRGVKIFLSL